MEKAIIMEREVYSGRLELSGEEHPLTLQAAYNYAGSLIQLLRLKEAKSLLRRTTPVARRVFGETHEVTLRMRGVYAKSLYEDDGATLDDLKTTAPRSTASARPRRRSRTRNQSRGACSVARIRW